VKFLKSDTAGLRFHFSAREKRILLELLELYPLVPASYPKLSRAADKSDDQDLLEQALAAQRAESKQQVRAIIDAPSRFQPDPHGHRVTFKPSELECLLQVLNDIRVGSWLLLGSPESLPGIFSALNDKTAPYFWAMEAAGEFQMTLLHALTGEETGPDRRAREGQ
jgi:hypothetical protein